jgi:phosphate butyryltransferase
MITSFEEVLKKARSLGRKIISVAAAGDIDVLKSIEQARLEGLVEGILIGDKKLIIQIATENNINLKNYDIVDEPDHIKSARLAVELVRNKKAAILMKGMVSTAIFLQAILDKEIGLRTNRILSHAYILEIKGYNRLLISTDGTMTIQPNLIQKAQIIQNAIDFCHCLEIKNPKVAVLAAVELVNPDMPATIDAACLAKMSERGQIKGGIVDGPLAFDNAISKEAALHKKIFSPVSGEVDIILSPCIEAANIFSKGMVFLNQAIPAGIVLGAKAPIVLVSRADSAQSKFYSIALGVLACMKNEVSS